MTNKTVSAVEEYRNGTSDFNRDADPRILSEIAGPAHFVMRLADAAIAGLEAELATEREHPTSVLQCAACQRLAVVQNAQLVERAEQAEAALAKFKSQLCDGCGFDARKEARRR